MDFSKLTKDDLEKMNKGVLITIILSMQMQLSNISNQLNFLTEQIALMNQRTFGRKTEQADEMHQITLFEYFNEPEALSDDSPEPEVSEVVVSTYTRKRKTKREEKLEGLPARIIEHTIDEAKLSELFPDGYKELPIETYKRLSIIPQTLMVDEHHVHVYASKKNDGTIIRAERPTDLFTNSMATPSLVASIMTGKYQNHLPLDRQSTVFKSNGVYLESNTLANWMIKASDNYLSLVYDELIKQLKQFNVIHADETPFRVIKKDKPVGGSKSYMWVYRSGAYDLSHPIIIYDYQPSRKAEHPEEFLGGYSGVLVTDGYQVYHSLEKKKNNLKVAGCWVHAKRKFAELVKALGDKTSDSLIAAEATKRISEIFHIDKTLTDLDKQQRKDERQRLVKPKVDDFFAWAKDKINLLPAGGATYDGLQYCINQEQFLRVFLSDGNVPMDNNLAEQAIRPFTLGRKNWVNMFSSKGAQSSSVIYSLVETAKANNLRVYDYLELLLSEIPKHMSDTNLDFLQYLMPWSDKVKEKCQVLSKPKTINQYLSL